VKEAIPIQKQNHTACSIEQADFSGSQSCPFAGGRNDCSDHCDFQMTRPCFGPLAGGIDTSAHIEPSVLSLFGGRCRPTENVRLSGCRGADTVLQCTVEDKTVGTALLASPLLSMINPFFAWEASWIEGVRDVLESPHKTY
jgi:hypothetical protein